MGFCPTQFLLVSTFAFIGSWRAHRIKRNGGEGWRGGGGAQVRSGYCREASSGNETGRGNKLPFAVHGGTGFVHRLTPTADVSWIILMRAPDG